MKNARVYADEKRGEKEEEILEQLFSPPTLLLYYIRPFFCARGLLKRHITRSREI